MDRMTALHSTCTILVISLDVMIDRHWGDLSDPAVASFWISSILDGLILGLLGGPPCETWSRARGRIVDGAHGPRVVRDLDYIWGRASLTLKELMQVTIGNLLMGFQLVAMAALAGVGGCAVLEHPGEPSQPELASIWRTPIMQLLLSLDECSRIDLSQGLWGAPTAKPTTLAVLNLPELLPALRAGQLNSDLPKGGSIGKTACGQWATSKLKEYPPGLCRALAQGFFSASNSCPISPESRVSSEFKSICKPMLCSDYTDFFGPDFVS